MIERWAKNEVTAAIEYLKPIMESASLDNYKKHLGMAISALEKQVAKMVETDEENNFYNCPCCNEDLMGCYGENDETAEYCLWCGQKLSWEELE